MSVLKGDSAGERDDCLITSSNAGVEIPQSVKAGQSLAPVVDLIHFIYM